jgi:type 1 glutamine amidotransferase
LEKMKKMEKMEKIRLHYLLGDVHSGGHDVHRAARCALRLLEAAGCFEVLVVCDSPALGDMGFDRYFASGKIREAAAFIFNCGNSRFNVRSEQEQLEQAVEKGAGFLLMHGDHPCYWPEAGMAAWEGFERLAGFLWREKTSHGDFGDFHISITGDHPIVKGLSDFDTRDEVFCTMENPRRVPYQALAAAYSDPAVVSRHGQRGTGCQEPVAIIGGYGKGRTYNQGLGHVWPCYTGHGLGENTLVSWMPLQFRIMFVRACEWIASGKVEQTAAFDGKVDLYGPDSRKALS